MAIKFTAQKKIVIRNEVDRFGFSYVLSQRFGLASTPRSFACYSHGWVWRTDIEIEDFGFYLTPRKTMIVVSTKLHQEFLLRSGFRNVFAGGLPFAYIDRIKSKRKFGSLLVMPPHSLAYNRISGFDEPFLNFINSIRNEFSEICFCLHADDVNDQEVTNSLKERNIDFIVGADASDANSLYRMREIFDYYDYVTTTVMGSHILYAAFCGCRVSLLRNHHYLYPKKYFSNYVAIKSVPGLEERYLDNFNNAVKLESQFPWLFANHPLDAIQMTEWASEEIGLSNLMDRDSLMKVLGWTISAKVSALIRVVSGRIVNGFYNLIRKNT